MNQDAIRQYVSDTFDGVDVVIPEKGDGPEIAWGDTFFIYDPKRDLEPKHRFPFATIVTKDYPGFDEASNLNRAGVFRLNIGIGKETFRSLFENSATKGSSQADHDYSVFDKILPHPTYGAQSWISVLNPSDETFHELITPLLAEAYQIAARRQAKRESTAGAEG